MLKSTLTLLKFCDGNLSCVNPLYFVTYNMKTLDFIVILFLFGMLCNLLIQDIIQMYGII